MDELLTMSNREITRLEVMQRLQEKRLSQKEAAGMLGMSTRQVKRLFRAYKTQGAQGLVSKRRGQPSHNRLDDELMQQVIDLIYERPLCALTIPIVFAVVSASGSAFWIIDSVLN